MDVGDGGAGLVHLVQELRGAVDALLERVGRPVDGALRDGHQAHHVGQVLDGAVQPAGLREAAPVLREDAVGEAGRREGFAQVAGVADRGRVAEGDSGLDDARVGGHLQPEAGPGLGLDGAGGHVLGLDRRRASSRER